MAKTVAAALPWIALLSASATLACLVSRRLQSVVCARFPRCHEIKLTARRGMTLEQLKQVEGFAETHHNGEWRWMSREQEALGSEKFRDSGQVQQGGVCVCALRQWSIALFVV